MKILFIGDQNAILRQCANQLRWKGYKVILHNDVMEGLREVSVFGVSCIVWDVQNNDASRLRKLNAIKRYHRFTPLILMSSDKEAFQIELDANTYFLANTIQGQELYEQIIQLVGVPSVYSENAEADEELEPVE
jgi:DNA-binding NtrC family response regulator